MVKHEPLSNEDLRREFKKYNIEFSDNVFRFTPSYSLTRKISFGLEVVKTISLGNSKTPIWKKIAFWTLRLTFTKGDSWLEDILDYRFDYDLTFELKDGSRYRKVLRDIDLFKNKLILEKLNADIQNQLIPDVL